MITTLIALSITAQAASSWESAEGFRPLFNGKTMAGWTAWPKGLVPMGWSVDNGVIAYTPGVEGGDISTTEQFGDFDLRMDWKIEPGGNSGIFYRAAKGFGAVWHSAPEMQVLDNARHPDGRNPATSAGACYALYACSKVTVKPAGQWNEVRIVAKGKHIQHWMNGVKVVEYDINSKDWTDRYKKSKFAEFPKFGQSPKGFIVLQDHGNRVWYRNIRIKPL